ncbi:hypothetical protein ABZ816_00320 [Actinosynnema sp. NPDC047251]|uniref:Secreted protein n=1 Tax=Saccharothrix espanaensis (strain ATCC 51144 / DSM 44229 / JCM 9112 / NBRC 15066 / NRRL 15764) TaxID=1179773 RepID=K0K1G1_SACES|nr:hypothetical protein [Saccharothrix espanaensis]CCH30694.1 hypothetical protein BN6_33960 [Saccharothrix espanaensis DSM 44229]
MKTKRVLRALAAIAALASCFSLATASPAMAADGWQRTTNVSDDEYNNGRAKVCALANPWGIDRAKACFQPHGEWFWLNDLSSNNEPAGMDWYSGNRSGVAYWDGSAQAGWTNLNKSFSVEGQRFTFRACEVNLSTRRVVESTCSDWEHTTT